MNTPRGRIVIVESALVCAEALRRRQFRVAVFPSADTAYYAAREIMADAFVVHFDERRDEDARLALIRKLRADPKGTPVIAVAKPSVHARVAAAAQMLGVDVLNVADDDCHVLVDVLEDALRAT